MGETSLLVGDIWISFLPWHLVPVFQPHINILRIEHGIAMRIRIGSMQQVIFVTVVGQQVVDLLIFPETFSRALKFVEVVQSPEFGEVCFVDAVYNVTKLIHLLGQITLRGSDATIRDCVEHLEGQCRITVNLAEQVLINIAQAAGKVCPMSFFW